MTYEPGDLIIGRQKYTWCYSRVVVRSFAPPNIGMPEMARVNDLPGIVVSALARTLPDGYRSQCLYVVFPNALGWIYDSAVKTAHEH